jgi:uncharacterized membrane protein YbhN (UPF0104 family)
MAGREAQGSGRGRRLAPAGIVFAALGLALFGYVVWQAGVEKIWAELQNLGWGFLVILALSGFRFSVRSYAWTLCFEGANRLRFRDAIKAFLAGDAVGNLTPLGLVVSEPTKVYFVRDRVPLVSAATAIAVENIFYSLSVILFILSGVAAMLLSFPLTRALRWTSVGIIAGACFFLLVGFSIVHAEWRILSGLAERLHARGIGRRALETRRATLRAMEDRVYGFYARNRRAFLPLMALESSFHLAGVAEAYVTLSFITGEPPSLLAAFVLESVNRVINVVFKFVPYRVGVDEAGTSLFTRVLRFGASLGVTLAIVRKARMLCWTAVGVALLVSRGLSVSTVVRDAEQTLAETKLGMRAEG